MDVTLSTCPQRGAGYVLVESDAFSAIAPEAQWRIMRVGVDKAYLGASSWQIPPFAHSLPKVGTNQFLLCPEIVSHMVPAANYRVTILQSGKDEISLVLAWRGIPGYRPGTDSTVFWPEPKSEADLIQTRRTSQPSAPERRPEPAPPAPPPVIQPPTYTQPAVPVTASPAVERKRIRCQCGQQILSSFPQCPWCRIDLTAGD